MRIGAEEADAILEVIREELSLLEQTEAPAVIPDSTMAGEPESPERVDGSRRGSVVRVGEFGRLSGSTGRRDSVISVSMPVEFSPSALFGMLNADLTREKSEKHAGVLAAIVNDFIECPESLKEDLTNIARIPTGEEEAAIAEAAMQAAIAAVPFGTEFVSFKNQAAPQMTKARGELDMEEDELPLTVREQRKRAAESTPASSASKKKKSTPTESAAAKALAFVEEELSLGGAKRKSRR
jgi:hypothetical protein